MRTKQAADFIKSRIIEPYSPEAFISERDVAYLIALFESQKTAPNAVYKNTGPITIDINNFSEDPVITNVIKKLKEELGPFEITAGFFFTTNYPHIIHNDDTFELPDEVYRGLHHRYSDTDKDPHSPEDGFWHSYILWMFKIKEGDVPVRSIPDLLRDPDQVFVHKYYSDLLWTVYGITALISVDAFFYLLAFPAFITLHVFCLQTSVVHYEKLGYKNYDTKDTSSNIPWLFPITQGECWHNNHHGDAKNPNYGGRRWWELDPTWWLIRVIKK